MQSRNDAVQAPSAILTYHSLDPSGSAISVSPERFSRHIEALRAANLTVCKLEEIRQAKGAIAITFDDGFANFREYALPLLSKYGMPATVFVVSGYCGAENGWPSQPVRVPRLPLMNWSALSEVAAAGCTLGAHTVTHPDLTKLPLAAAEREIYECQQELQQRTGAPVRSFSFPYGAAGKRIQEIAARYFDRACGTKLDYVTAGSDDRCLPRIDAYYLETPKHFRTLLTRQGQRRIALRRFARETRQWLFR